MKNTFSFRTELTIDEDYLDFANNLDDFLRKPNPTQSERSAAFDVINRRYNDGKITLVTSEHSIDELMNTDEAVASRIREMCGAAYCMSIAPDRRKNYRLHGKP